MLTRFLLFAALFWQQPASLPTGAPAQLPRGTATVEGAVVAAANNQPIPGAYVEMRRTECSTVSGGETINATTDGDGKFSFKNVRAGSWCLGVVRAGGAFSPLEYDQRGYKGRGLSIPITDNQQVTGLRLLMVQTGGISGRVLDSDGEPFGHARVLALEPFYQDGKKRLYILNVVQTNDLGEFSLFWLPPGQYYVAAVAEDPLRQQVMFSVAPPGMGGHRADVLPPVVSRRVLETGEVLEEAYNPVFYGGGTDVRGAQPVEVRPGTNAVVDLSFAGARTQAWHIRGRLINGVTGQPASGAQLRLLPKEWSSIVVAPYATADNNGNFDIAGVVPGSYVLYANSSTRDPAAPPGAVPAGLPAAALQQLLSQGVNIGTLTGAAIPISVRVPVEMGGMNLDSVSLTLVPGFVVNGDLIFEGTLGTEIPQQMRTSIRPNFVRMPDTLGAPGVSNQAPAADGTFRVQNVTPGDYQVLLTPFQQQFQWGSPVLPEVLSSVYVKSIRLGSSDVLAEGLHLTTTAPEARLQIVLAKGIKLEGSVSDDRQSPARNVKVALVPDFPNRNRIDLYRSATTDGSGKFRMQAIPPGDYKIYAWEDIVDGAWQDQEVLRAYDSRGRAIRIEDGRAATVEITVIR